MADPENFGGGGFEAQNLKNSDVFTKTESDFSAEIGNSNVFFAQIQVVSKKQKKDLYQNWDWFFGRNRKLKRFFRPNSGGLQKIKGLHQNLDWFFAGLVTFRSVGGDASRNGAELFETEADFSAKIVTFRLVGGRCIPHPPPKSATDQRYKRNFPHCFTEFFKSLNAVRERSSRSKSENKLYLPIFSALRCQKSFKYYGAKIWNSIPFEVRKQPFSKFKANFKKSFLESYR